MTHRTTTAIVAAGIAVLAVAPAARAQASSDRVTVAPAASGAAALPMAPASAPVDLAVQLPLRDAAAAEALASAVSTPGNAQYGHYVTPAQFDARFAPTAAQAAAVKSFLTGNGLRIVDAPSNNRYVEVEGTVAQVNKAFAVHLRTDTRRAGGPVADTAVTVPSSIAADVLTVTGLEGGTFQPGHVTGDGGTAAAKTSDRNTVPTPCSDYWAENSAVMPTAYARTGFPTSICGYTANQLASAYGVKGLAAHGNDGHGQTVAIIDAYNLDTIVSDTNTLFRHEFTTGLRPNQYDAIEPTSYSLQRVCQEESWHAEQALDVQSVHGVAPGANILYVAGRSCSYNGLLLPMNKVVDGHLANIVSNSWGTFGEVTNPTSVVRAYHAVFVQAAAEGIGMNFCSLDDGDLAASEGSAQAVYPASDPFVTGVGGTTLGVSAAGGRAVEQAWGSARAPVAYDSAGNPVGYTQAPPGSFYAGAGGGTSTLFNQPAYQRGVVPDALARAYSNTRMRVEPDIAAVADPYTGYLIGYTSGGVYSEFAYGGTSLATPVISALFAIASQHRATPIGFANPLLYTSGVRDTIFDVAPDRAPTAMAFTSSNPLSLCYDSCLITTDRDTSLHGATGFDDVTGLGAPRDAAFITALRG